MPSSGVETMGARANERQGALRRFNAAEGAFSPAFNRRRANTLRMGSYLMIMAAVPWAAYFAHIGHLIPALFESTFVLAGLSVLSLTRARLLRVGSLLFSLAGLVMIVGLSVAVDVPTPAVPRATHLYLIPLTVAAYFLLQNEVATIRVGVPVLSLAAFVLLATSGDSYGFLPVMDDPSRRNAVGFVALFTSVGLYATLHVMLREAKESTALEQAFTIAIAAREIEVYLQPQCTADGRITGAEALMRWHHPQRGYISPAEFIPMAERSGLIIPAGALLLSMVCKLLQRWESDPALSPLCVSVNISPAQLFSGDAADRLLAKVPDSVVQRGALKFELTESMFVHDFEMVRARMDRIRARGIGIALDDFGTGFSSLNYLRQLPLDQLKVDQSFVRDLASDVNADKIARTIVQLGQDLGLQVVAEGTETAEQVNALQDMGCRIFQGFLFSRPLPAEAFETLAQDVSAGRRSLVPPGLSLR